MSYSPITISLDACKEDYISVLRKINRTKPLSTNITELNSKIGSKTSLYYNTIVHVSCTELFRSYLFACIASLTFASLAPTTSLIYMYTSKKLYYHWELICGTCSIGKWSLNIHNMLQYSMSMALDIATRPGLAWGTSTDRSWQNIWHVSKEIYYSSNCFACNNSRHKTCRNAYYDEAQTDNP